MKDDKKIVRVLNLSYLNSGAIFQFDICDKSGTVLLKSNTTLTQEKLDDLKNQENLYFTPPEVKPKGYFVEEVKECFQQIIQDADSISAKTILTLREVSQKVMREVQSSLQQGSLPLHEMVKSQDENLYHHSMNMGLMAMAMAVTMPKDLGMDFSKLGDESKKMKDFFLGAVLHDIGYSAIPRDLIHKDPASFSKREKILFNSHPHEGYKLLLGMEIRFKEKLSDITKQCVLFHHERYDDSGFPTQLPFTGLPQPPKLIAILELYESLVHNPHTRQEEIRNTANALKALVNAGKTYLDPQLLEKFINKLGIYLTNGIVFYRKDDAVILNTGDVGLIESINTETLMSPSVRILYNHLGIENKQSLIIDLSRDPRTIHRFISKNNIEPYISKMKKQSEKI